ncbi:hypothetical protein BVRB_8g191120 [Beta vulgaris subsp. vulgaris]|nr:hypothetical protein BVRB_8g191120 [Beta vulgaris subsp. vulgaris]
MSRRDSVLLNLGKRVSEKPAFLHQFVGVRYPYLGVGRFFGMLTSYFLDARLVFSVVPVLSLDFAFFAKDSEKYVNCYVQT